jgi:hypothetical protein
MANSNALTGPEIEVCKSALEGDTSKKSGKEIVDAAQANPKLAKYAADQGVDVNVLRAKLKSADAVDLQLLEKAIQ